MTIPGCLESPVNGYFGGGLYARMGGKIWIRQMVLSAFLMPSLVCGTAFFINFIAMYYHASRYEYFYIDGRYYHTVKSFQKQKWPQTKINATFGTLWYSFFIPFHFGIIHFVSVSLESDRLKLQI